MMSSRTKWLALIAGLVIVAAQPCVGWAQCDFPHPTTAKKTTMALVQSFIPCNACVCTHSGYDGASCSADAECRYLSPEGSCFCRSSNTSTLGGIPSCKPPYTVTTANEADPHGPPVDPPSGGWRWGSGSRASVSFTAASNRLPTAYPENTADLAVIVDARGIEDATGPATGPGSLVVIVRFTADGRVTGDQTVIDVPVHFHVPVTDGEAHVKTSYNAFLASVPQPLLPGCSSVQLIDVTLKDPGGAPFASPGVYLPRLN